MNMLLHYYQLRGVDMIKNIGVLTGGGDSSGINAVIRTIVRRAEATGVKVTGIRNGWEGLIKNDTVDLSTDNTQSIIYTGGTILGTSRTNPYKREGGVASLLNTLETEEIDSLIVLGGDDTLSVASRISQTTGIPVVGIAQSIDNDIAETEYCVGFDSAVSRVVDAVNSVRTTCVSHGQDIVVEVMGRETGWIAAAAAVATEAEFCIIPEISFDIENLAKAMESRRRNGNPPGVVIVAEGCTIQGCRRIEDEKLDAFGHPYLAGIAYPLRDTLQTMTGLTIRTLILGYIQRGGAPTSYEVQMAVRLGHQAVDYVMSSMSGKLVAVRNSDIEAVDLVNIAGRKRYVCGEMLNLVKSTWY
jgi:6-phosphofructokinase 1